MPVKAKEMPTLCVRGNGNHDPVQDKEARTYREKERQGWRRIAETKFYK